MPLYFFDLHDDIETVDDEGKELPDADAARAHAERSAREIACTEVLAGRLALSHRIDIRDERGELVGTVCFGDAIEIET